MEQKIKDPSMRKVALLFPGVGSQHVGMGKEFHDNFKVVRATFEEAGEALKMDLAALCFDPAGKESLAGLLNSQVALFTLCVSIYRVYRQEICPPPQYALGHSLGELSALCSAGVLRLVDALALVKERGNILNRAAATMNGLMAWVINLDNNIVREVCREYHGKAHVYVSAYDAPMQSSISGMSEDIRQVGEQLVKKGAIVYPLKLSGPFHSPYMEPAVQPIKTLIQQYRFGESIFPVIANRNARPYSGNRQDTIRNLSEQLICPILWQDSLAYLQENQVQIAVEVGPDRVLKHLVKNNTSSIFTYSLRDLNDLKALQGGLNERP
ncbi:MAG: ACP S-malonyltransferase [Candidatus Aminicenantes bacterium]